jgi:hypothetical protein
MNQSLTKRKPFIDEYLQSVSWRDMVAKLGDRRPLIFIFINKTNQVVEIQLKEESDLAYVERTKQVDNIAMAVKKVAESTAAKSAPRLVSPPMPPAPPVVESPKEEAPSTPVVSAEEQILKEALSAVAAQEGTEQQVVVGRWVEFIDGSDLLQGKIVEISADESKFTLAVRGVDDVMVVDALQLQNLIPDPL